MPARPAHLLAVVSLSFSLAATALHADPIQVKTAEGKVEGRLSADTKVRAFKGIPYAAPPVGNLRWQAPQPLDARNIAVWRPEDRALSEQIEQYWTNFARTGNPNGPGLPTWPAYHPPAWNVMHLDATSAAKPDTQRARYEFLAAHPPKH